MNLNLQLKNISLVPNGRVPDAKSKLFIHNRCEITSWLFGYDQMVILFIKFGVLRVRHCQGLMGILLSLSQGFSERRRPSRPGSSKPSIFPPWLSWLMSKLLEYKAWGRLHPEEAWLEPQETEVWSRFMALQDMGHLRGISNETSGFWYQE